MQSQKQSDGFGDYPCLEGKLILCEKRERRWHRAPGSIPVLCSGLFGGPHSIGFHYTIRHAFIIPPPSPTTLLASQSIHLFSFLVLSLSFSPHVLRSHRSIQSHCNKSSFSSTVWILCRCGFIYDRSLSCSLLVRVDICTWTWLMFVFVLLQVRPSR